MAGHYPDWPETFSGPGGIGVSDHCGYRIIIDKTVGKKEYSFSIYPMDKAFSHATGPAIRRAGLTFRKKSDAFKRAVAILDADFEPEGDT
jgi:hypothetical protein